MRNIKLLPIVALLAVGGLALNGCKSDSSSGGGVDKDSIKLGVLVDLSGPFAATGKDFTVGMNVALDEVNGAGGVCDRKLEPVIKDHSYDVQKGVLAYEEVAPKVSMMTSILGSAITAALHDKIVSDHMLANVSSYSDALLGVPNFIVPGTTYDVTAVNSLAYLVDQGVLKEGDAIGEFYLEGEGGESAHRGIAWGAKELGLKLDTHMVKPTDADFASQVAAMRKDGVKAISMSTTGAQVAAVAAVAEASGLNVPLMGQGPAWNTSLFDTAAAGALEKNFYRGLANYSLGDQDSPKSVELTEAYEKATGGATPLAGSGVALGYASVMISKAVLESTCDDLSREAVLKARANVQPFDVDGLYAMLDIRNPDVSPGDASIVEKADKASIDGVKIVQTMKASDLAKKYLASK